MISNSFGEKLRDRRKALKLTQIEFAKMLGVSQVTVANYERGKRFPKPGILMIISGILNASLDSLLGDSGNYPETYRGSGSGRFDADTLIGMLLQASFEDVFSYTAYWKDKKNLDLAAFYENIIMPALELTGDLWLKGEMMVSEEHLITEKIRELILLHANRDSEQNKAAPDKRKRWMGLCAPGEQHELALFMNAQVLRLLGWNVYNLGTQLPFDDLAGIIKKYDPLILAISITMAENQKDAVSYIKQINESFAGHPAVILGGRGATLLPRECFRLIHGIAGSVMDGVSMAEALVTPGN